MAPKSELHASKRKLANASKEKSSKKPKFDKKPPRKEEPEDVSDESDVSEFSDLDNGGAPLHEGKSELGSDLVHRSRLNDNESGKVFEKGVWNRQMYVE